MAKKDASSKKDTGLKKNNDYLIVMSQSPLAKSGYKQDALSDFTPNAFQLMVSAFFTAVILMIVRMYSYQRDMSQFYWNPSSSGELSNLADFFSYYKMVAIIICAILAILVIIYHVFCQTLVIRRSFIYIPMGVYCVFVLLSYAFSDYKDFALYGYNDRFEGTVTLLCYMVMVFYIFNIITSEKSVKWIIYSVAVTSVLLGFLGLSQALDVDFFRTTIGKKLITPSYYWGSLDQLSFTFQNREIYQTVYNINYVSFYLTLLVPIFAMLFIREAGIKKKIIWGALFTLALFNMIGAQSSGGIAGIGVMVVIAIIVLNKCIIQWIKPIAILLLLVVLVGAVTFNRFAPELFGAVNSVLGKQVLQIPGQEDTKTTPGGSESATPEVTDQTSEVEEATQPEKIRTHIDYMRANTNSVSLSLNGEELELILDNISDPASGGIRISDKDGNPLPFVASDEDNGTYSISDPRFSMLNIQPAVGQNNEYYILFNIDEVQWAFQVMPEGFTYRNQLGKQIELVNAPHVGFENNPGFGSGRGYIWSRSIPLFKDTFIIGYGADTYCIYFPHNDYVGKYNAGWDNLNLVADKPHNMYIGIITGTGGISFLAFLTLVFFFIGQSAMLYFRHDFQNRFLSAAGVGIFLGVCGFLVSAFVNDSTVSVMPLFYGLLATGISINFMLKSRKV